MLKHLLKQVLHYGKNGLAAVGGAEIACYALCGTLVFCFLCGAVTLRWTRRITSPDELTKSMQKNALSLRVFRLQAKLLYLLLAAVCGLDFLYAKEVFSSLPIIVTFFTLYALCAVILCLVYAALVRTANKRAQLRYKIARLTEERRLMSLRDTRLFSELHRLERVFTLSSQTKRRAEPVEPMPAAPVEEPMPTAPVEEPMPESLPHADPFAPTPYAEPPKREGEMPEITQPLRKECKSSSRLSEKTAHSQTLCDCENSPHETKNSQEACKTLPHESKNTQEACKSLPCESENSPLGGISHAKISDLLQRLSALPLSEGDALAAKKIELCLKEALLSGGTPQQVSSQLSALLKILARYEAA